VKSEKFASATKIIHYSLYIIHFSLTLQQNNYNNISSRYEKKAFTTRPEPVCHDKPDSTGAGTDGAAV
jgi:hypothetical protein